MCGYPRILSHLESNAQVAGSWDRAAKVAEQSSLSPPLPVSCPRFHTARPTSCQVLTSRALISVCGYLASVPLSHMNSSVGSTLMNGTLRGITGIRRPGEQLLPTPAERSPGSCRANPWGGGWAVHCSRSRWPPQTTHVT